MTDHLHFPDIPQDEWTEWSYSMRRDMQEIIPGLFLGPYASAMKSKLLALQQLGISHIVCIRQQAEANVIKPNFPSQFVYLVVNISDSLTESIITHFPKIRDFVDECFRTNGKVLIHGNGGISRSASIVIAYIMEKYGLSYKQAFQYVQQKRFCIHPNEGFANQLVEYEPIYKARLLIKEGQTSCETVY